MKKIPVLILAGSRLGEQDILAQAGKVPHKVLLPIGKIPMVERVYDAIKGAGIASEIFIASENKCWLENTTFEDVNFLQAASTLPETIFMGLKRIGFPCLIVTADHALLRPEWVQEFLEKSQNTLADITFAIALKKEIEELSIKSKRTYINLSDIQFSGCNLFFLKNPSSKKIISLWKEIYHLRKSPLRMVRILGLSFLIKALCKKLDSKSLLEKIKKITNASLEFVVLKDGKAAIDVDTISDWELVENFLALDTSKK